MLLHKVLHAFLVKYAHVITVYVGFSRFKQFCITCKKKSSLVKCTVFQPFAKHIFDQTNFLLH